MSRLIVKNLPNNISEQKIRELFSEKGLVTDVQLKYKNGKFRQFCFVGYQNDNEADEAVKSFNQMFIQTNRITVEKCAVLGDENKPKSWSKYAPDSKVNKKIEETIKESKKHKQKDSNQDETLELLKKYQDDPLFEEYLQVHAPQETEKLHSLVKSHDVSDENDDNNDENDSDNSNSDNEEEPNDNDKLANQEISDLEYMKKLMGKDKSDDGEKKPRQKTAKKVKEKLELFTVKLQELPYNCTKKDLKQFFRPNTPYSLRIPRKIHGIAFAGFKTEKAFNKALMKNRSFINGKQVTVIKYIKGGSDDNNKNEVNNNPKQTKWKNQEESLKNEEDIAESGRIFVRNLAYTTTEEDIETLFTKYGPVTEVNLPIDNVTRKTKGFGVVTFLMPEHAVKAYSELDGSVLHGRMLHLLPGKSKNTENTEINEDSSNFKQKKAAKQKSQAGSSHNWNSLFLGHDAVAEVIADTYGTSKENVLAPHGEGSAAVRLALGETQIVAQTRKYLEAQGVLLDTFSNASVKRSKTVILVKNLPSKTEQREIRALFEKHGVVGRVILPPSGITAIVEFMEPTEARKAFTRLAYSKFKNVPLYLEWAPENSLSPEKPSSASNKTEDTTNSDNSGKINDEKTSENNEEEEEEPEPDTTLFVKNLNFKTTDADLKKHFESCGKIHYATVATKKDKSNPSSTLSMGYGFVRFVHKSSADKALKTLQQSDLDGKSLELKRSERTLKNEVNAPKKVSKHIKQTGTKILVRNVPFQANKKEIQELFSVFGNLKAVRLPKKMAAGSDSHRGYAFVDFTTESDAKSAFEALCQSTHLYGRRLVLEWASAEDSVDELRKRTADHFKETEEVKSKKSVFSIE